MQVCEFIFTARCARVAKGAKKNSFSIAVERTAMEKYQAAFAAETKKNIDSFTAECHTNILLPEGLRCFAFRRLSEKQKKSSAFSAALR